MKWCTEPVLFEVFQVYLSFKYDLKYAWNGSVPFWNFKYTSNLKYAWNLKYDSKFTWDAFEVYLNWILCLFESEVYLSQEYLERRHFIGINTTKQIHTSSMNWNVLEVWIWLEIIRSMTWMMFKYSSTANFWMKKIIRHCFFNDFTANSITFFIEKDN